MRLSPWLCRPGPSWQMRLGHIPSMSVRVVDKDLSICRSNAMRPWNSLFVCNSAHLAKLSALNASPIARKHGRSLLSIGRKSHEFRFSSKCRLAFWVCDTSGAWAAGAFATTVAAPPPPKVLQSQGLPARDLACEEVREAFRALAPDLRVPINLAQRPEGGLADVPPRDHRVARGRRAIGLAAFRRLGLSAHSAPPSRRLSAHLPPGADNRFQLVRIHPAVFRDVQGRASDSGGRCLSRRPGGRCASPFSGPSPAAVGGAAWHRHMPLICGEPEDCGAGHGAVCALDLLRSVDVLLVQEAHCGAEFRDAMEAARPSHRVCWQPVENGRAVGGLALFVAHSLMQKFEEARVEASGLAGGVTTSESSGVAWTSDGFTSGRAGGPGSTTSRWGTSTSLRTRRTGSTPPPLVPRHALSEQMRRSGN